MEMPIIVRFSREIFMIPTRPAQGHKTIKVEATGGHKNI